MEKVLIFADKIYRRSHIKFSKTSQFIDLSQNVLLVNIKYVVYFVVLQDPWQRW